MPDRISMTQQLRNRVLLRLRAPPRLGEQRRPDAVARRRPAARRPRDEPRRRRRGRHHDGPARRRAPRVQADAVDPPRADHGRPRNERSRPDPRPGPPRPVRRPARGPSRRIRRGLRALRPASLRTRPVAAVPAATVSAGAAGYRPSQRAKFARSRRPARPDFSGWNCVAARLPRPTIEAKRVPAYSVVQTASAGSAGAG